MQIEALRGFKAATEKKEEAAQALTQQTAASLPRTIGKALQSQMSYQKNLKYSSRNIAYVCGGVTPEVFRSAFPGAIGGAVSVSGESLGVNGKV